MKPLFCYPSSLCCMAQNTTADWCLNMHVLPSSCRRCAADRMVQISQRTSAPPSVQSQILQHRFFPASAGSKPGCTKATRGGMRRECRPDRNVARSAIRLLVGKKPYLGPSPSAAVMRRGATRRDAEVGRRHLPTRESARRSPRRQERALPGAAPESRERSHGGHSSHGAHRKSGWP